MESLRAWLTLRAVNGISDRAVCRLVDVFGSPAMVRAASLNALMEQGGVNRTVAQAIRDDPDHETRSRIDREVQMVEQHKLSIVTILDSWYPRRLKMTRILLHCSM